jgi:hydroxypyruvate isomerase
LGRTVTGCGSFFAISALASAVIAAPDGGMLRLSANLSLLFTERPFLERFAAARACGFRAVEVQFPYEVAASEIATRLDGEGLELVLHNLPAGNWGAGERGLAALPGRQAEFRDGVERAIAYALQLGCPRLNALAGLRPQTATPEDADAVMINNLGFAAAALAQAGLLLVEPINRGDVPGFHVATADHALALIDAVGAPNIALQYDVYHAAMMREDPVARVAGLMPRIGHIQIADAPGRHEPGTGAIDFPALFAALQGSGYRGWIGCEYMPAADTEAGLRWMAR